MTYDDKIKELSKYQKRKMIGVALRADLDYWESFATAMNTDKDGGGGGVHNNTSPTENAAEKALHVRNKIERNIAELLLEREKLIRAFDCLPDADKEIMYLLYIAGFPMKQAAQYMKLTPNAVSKRHRAIVQSLVDGRPRKAHNDSV